MNRLPTRQFLSFLVTSSMVLPSLENAMAPLVFGDMDSSAASTGAGDEFSATAGTPANNPSTVTSEAINSGNKPLGTQVMGGMTLPKTPMTIDFQEADVKDVFHLLAVKSGLNIIYGADVTGPVTVHLDRVPFDQAFQTILTLKGLVALPMGARVVRVVTSVGLTTEQSQAATFTRVFRLNYASADDIKKPVDAIRSAAGRKGVSTVDTKTNSLIITDTQEGLKEVEDLIPVLDKKPQQVDIEAKVVEVNLSNDINTGISWQYAASGGGGAYDYGATQAQASSNAAGIGAVVSGNSISALPPGSGGTGLSLGGVAAASSGFAFLTRQGTYLLGAQISALVDENKAKVLSTPHVVTTNNEEATINVADQIPYLVSTVSNGVSQQSVQFISAGVKLTVKPTVNADHRITLHVKPEVSNAVGTALPNLPPTVNTRDADTTVLLRDGETIAIGGLITEQTTKAVTGVPILMNIPILGYLFKTTSDSKSRTELIVFLTPKITAE